MNQIKTLIVGICVSVLLFFVPVMAFGQGPMEPSYEVSLQLLIGSNDVGQKGNLPQGLSAVAQSLKSNFAFSNYRLTGTFIGRISNNGDFSYKSVSNTLGKETEFRSPSFLEWSINSLKTGPTAKGQNFQLQAFRFGVRVPIILSTAKDESGKESSVTNYENIGLSMIRLGLPENTPTLIGTLNLPGATDTLFLVVTVKASDL